MSIAFGVHSLAPTLAPFLLGPVADTLFRYLLGVVDLPRSRVWWLGPAVTVFLLAGYGLTDLGNPNYAYQPSVLISGLYAVINATSRGISTETSWTLLSFPLVYIAAAYGLGAPGTFYPVHMLHFFILMLVVCVVMWSLREEELSGLRHVRLMDTMREQEMQSDEILALMLPSEVLAKLKESRSTDPLLLRRYADGFEAASVLFIEIQAGNGLGPSSLLDLLNTVFQNLDEMVKDAGALKIETIGEPGGVWPTVALGSLLPFRVARPFPVSRALPPTTRVALYFLPRRAIHGRGRGASAPGRSRGAAGAPRLEGEPGDLRRHRGGVRDAHDLQDGPPHGEARRGDHREEHAQVPAGELLGSPDFEAELTARESV